LTDFPFGYSAAQGFNAANHFMARNTRQTQTGVDSDHRGRIGVTDSTCFNPNPDLTRSGLGDRRSTTRSTPGEETSTALYVALVCGCLSWESCVMKVVPFEAELLMFFCSDFKLSLVVRRSGLQTAEQSTWIKVLNRNVKSS
jgi:hypothetical protein